MSRQDYGLWRELGWLNKWVCFPQPWSQQYLALKHRSSFPPSLVVSLHHWLSLKHNNVYDKNKLRWVMQLLWLRAWELSHQRGKVWENTSFWNHLLLIHFFCLSSFFLVLFLWSCKLFLWKLIFDFGMVWML